MNLINPQLSYLPVWRPTLCLFRKFLSQTGVVDTAFILFNVSLSAEDKHLTCYVPQQ